MDKSHSVECDTKGDEDLVDKIQSVDCETMDLGRQRCRVRHDESSSERTAVRGLRKMYWWRRWRRRGVISQRKQCALDDGHEIMCSDSDVASLLQTPIFTHTENEKNMENGQKRRNFTNMFFSFSKTGMSAPSWAIGTPTLRCIMFTRSLSSYHDTFSTSPSHRYIHAATKNMSHSCDCKKKTNHRLVCHV